MKQSCCCCCSPAAPYWGQDLSASSTQFQRCKREQNPLKENEQGHLCTWERNLTAHVPIAMRENNFTGVVYRTVLHITSSSWWEPKKKTSCNESNKNNSCHHTLKTNKQKNLCQEQRASTKTRKTMHQQQRLLDREKNSGKSFPPPFFHEIYETGMAGIPLPHQRDTAKLSTSVEETFATWKATTFTPLPAIWGAPNFIALPHLPVGALMHLVDLFALVQSW